MAEQARAEQTGTEQARAEQVITEPITVALSRDELLVVLGALGAETIPGIDVEPSGDWTERERSIAGLVAARSLIARGLARRNDDGELALHTDLLNAVGVCVHSESAAFVFHWPDKEEVPIRYFGHAVGDGLVLHARPNETVHLFTLMPSKAEFLSQILAVCGMAVGADEVSEHWDHSSSEHHEFRVPAAMLAEVRKAPNSEQASRLLIEQGVNAKSAQALAEDLINPGRLSILQTIRQTDMETVVKRDFTLLENGRHSWLMAAESVVESAAEEVLPLLIKTTTRDELSSLLDEWI